MANIRYNYPSDNVIGNATITLSTGTAPSPYVIANLADVNPGFPFIWDAATGRINLNFGSAQTVKLVAICHHNLQAGLTVKWEAGATLGASTFSQAFTIGAVDGSGYRPNSYLDLSAAPPNFQYHSLKIEGTNPDPVIIGCLWVGAEVRTLVHNISWGYSRENPRPGLTQWTTRAGIQWTYPAYGYQRLITGNVQTTDAGVAALDAWFQRCGGPEQPTIVIPGTVDITDAMLAKWAVPWKFSQQIEDNVTLDVGWLDVGRGLPWP